MKTYYLVIGIIGIVGGVSYILTAALSRWTPYRHNPGLYMAGGIALVGGIILLFYPWGAS